MDLCGFLLALKELIYTYIFYILKLHKIVFGVFMGHVYKRGRDLIQHNDTNK